MLAVFCVFKFSTKCETSPLAFSCGSHGFVFFFSVSEFISVPNAQHLSRMNY